MHPQPQVRCAVQLQTAEGRRNRTGEGSELLCAGEVERRLVPRLRRQHSQKRRFSWELREVIKVSEFYSATIRRGPF